MSRPPRNARRSFALRLTLLASILAALLAPTVARASASPAAHASSSRAGQGSSRAGAKKTKKRKKKKKERPVLHGDAALAFQAYEAMQQHYAIAGSGLYLGEPFSYLWPFSQALAATISTAHIPHSGVSLLPALKEQLVGLSNYLDSDNSGEAEGVFTSTLPAYDAEVAPPAGPGGPKYYDDNDWVGIELMRLYELQHSSAVLADAEVIMAFEMAGWQSSPQLACPGGLPFSNSLTNTERNTVTTAPAAELAVQLYRATGRAGYLQFAEQAYQWVRSCLLEADGMYADHIGPHGTVEPMLWSYNQGSMIGAGALLYEETGNQQYLQQAQATAHAALGYFTIERLEYETPFFPAVYFRNLIYLDAITRESSAARLAQDYVNNAFAGERESGDLFVYGTTPEPQLLVQASITQICALLASSPNTYF